MTTTITTTAISTTDSQETASQSQDWMICKSYVADVAMEECRQKMDKLEFGKATLWQVNH